jgi:hypothetical protein
MPYAAWGMSCGVRVRLCHDRAHERCGGCDLVADIFHAMSQPRTALEVGLEISLWQDQDVAQLRARVGSALEIAQGLHQRLGGRREKARSVFDLRG